MTAIGNGAGIGGGNGGTGGNSVYYIGANGGSGGGGGTVTITSGTVVVSGSTADIGKGNGASGGYNTYSSTKYRNGYTGSDGGNASLYISGGSVNADVSYSVYLSSAVSTPMYQTIVSGLPANESLSCSYNNGASFVSQPDDNGCLYLWLPAGACTVLSSNTGGLYEASGTIAAVNTNVITAYSLSTALSALSVSDADSNLLSLYPSFDSDIVAYVVDTNSASVNSITVTATAEDPASTLTIGGVSATSGVAASVSLDNGANLIPVTVTSSDGLSQKSYILSVNGTVSNAALASLSFGTAAQTVDSSTTAYTYSVGSDVTSVAIKATPSDSKAIMLLDGAILASGDSQGVDLSVGENVFTLMVVAQDATTKTYTITVNRGTSDATLKTLALSSGTLSPSFSAAVYSYTATVSNSITSLTVTPTANDAGAAVKVNGTSASTPVTLSVGSNTITIKVTGSDGVTTKTYTVTVTRETAIVITTTSLPVGIVSASYSKALAATGGSGSYTWTWAAASGSSLPSGITLSTDGVLTTASGSVLTDVDAGTYSVEITATDTNDASVTQTASFTLTIREGCGNGGYLIESNGDTAYTGSYTDDGIPTLTVNTGHTGFTYFGVDISAVTGHPGTEACVFVQIRNGQQIAICATKGDFDTLGSAYAAFNVKPGDIIEVYLVDSLSNSGSSPIIL